MKDRLQSMYNHMVARAASVVSPFYFILITLKVLLNDYLICIPYYIDTGEGLRQKTFDF